MKLNRLETHDRLQHFKQDQSINIAHGAEECLKHNRLSIGLQQHSPYIYLFAHPRTADDGVTKKMYWQPRLCKPLAQTNSYLFRAISKTDQMEVCWLLPPEEMWSQYDKGLVTENEIVVWSINQYKTNIAFLEKPDIEDFSDEKVKWIYQQVASEIDAEILQEKWANGFGNLM